MEAGPLAHQIQTDHQPPIYTSPTLILVLKISSHSHPLPSGSMTQLHTKDDLQWPKTYQPACSWDVAGNRSIWIKPSQLQGEHQIQTRLQPSSGVKNEPGSLATPLCNQSRGKIE